MNDRPTYPELLKLFYKHSFPDQLGAAGSSVAQAIIYKANELYFPSDFIMSNVELSHLSGADVSNLGRVRQRVCEICVIDGKPLFHYVGNTKRRAGKYIIDYRLPSLSRHSVVTESSNCRQIDPLIDDDLNLTLPNVTKTTTGAGDLVMLMQKKWPHPNPPNLNAIQRMIDKYTLSVCVDAMDGTPDDMVNSKWSSVYSYMRKVATNLIPKAPKIPDPEKKAINSMTQLVLEYRDIGGNGRSRTGATKQATINRMTPYSKWYADIDNFGDIVGMQIDEYEALVNGGCEVRDGVRAFDKMSETAVISAMLLGDDAAIDCAEAVLGDGMAFKIKLHELIYDAILALRDTDTPIDPANIAALIDLKQIGKSREELHAWLVEFTMIGDTWSIESIQHHASRIRDMAELRDVDQRLRRLVMESLTEDADLSNVYGQLEEIMERRSSIASNEVISVSGAKEIYKQYVADLQKRKVNFGWPSIDKATRGLVPGDVCLIFARTNVGKSALAQSMQLSIWERQKIKSIFFSLEMPVTSVYERMASIVSGWAEEAVEEVFLAGDEDRLLEGMSKYEGGVFFVEKSKLMLKDIARITKTVDDIGVIFIDYMGLVRALGRSPYERLSSIATGMKETAKELGIAVVCICQLSRKAGDGSVPVTFEMVRDSGQIEEATDVILGMHRSENDDFIHLSVLKARRGRKGASCEVNFTGDTPKIVEVYRNEL